MNRRQFVLVSAAAGAPEWRNRQPGMTYSLLGRTGLMVSRIAMGGNSIRPGKCDHVLAALDRGLNYLDTAPAYGNGACERAYATVIQARRRDTFFLNTKVTLFDANRNRVCRELFDSLPESEQKKLRAAADEQVRRRQALEPDHFIGYFRGQQAEIEAASLSDEVMRRHGHKLEARRNFRQLILDSIDQSLERLGTDHLDLMMCPHGANTPLEVTDAPEIFEAFETLKRQGKVRFLGFSAHSNPGAVLEAAASTGRYDFAMVAYNIVNRAWVEPAIRRATRQGMGVLAMKSTRAVASTRATDQILPARVKLIDDAVPGSLKIPQKAIAWVLKNPQITAVVSDMETMAHVEDNLPLAALRT